MPSLPYSFTPGSLPLLVSMPHAGTEVPMHLAARLTEAARPLPDTDWHVDQLYDFLGDMGVGVLAGRYSRYVVDLNRPATDESLYPGQTTTGLFPAETFEGRPVWSAPPTEEEKARIRREIWAPYHGQIAGELARLREEHGFALLWEAHSIAPVLPRLFEGQLPDLNLGTNGGGSCPDAVLDRVLAAAQGDGRSVVANGRFKGGFITRHFGRPEQKVFAIQLELSQSTYMEAGTWNGGGAPRLDFQLAEGLRPLLRRMIQAYIAAAADHLETQA